MGYAIDVPFRVLLWALVAGQCSRYAVASRQLFQDPHWDSEPNLSLMLNNLQTRSEQRYNWFVKVEANKHVINLAADKSGWLPVEYQVAYSKTAAAKAALGLSGRLVVQNEGDTDITISPPNITATLNTGQAVPVPSSLVRCPTLTIPGSSSVTCDFTVTKHGSRPIAGSITAFVEVPAANGKPAESAKADAVHFTFMNARLVTEGEFAVVSDFFEPGEGLVQPHSVFGKQPSTNLRIGDSQTFMFTGWYGGLDQALCGKELKAVNTAELTPSSTDPKTQVKMKKGANTLKVLPSCDDKAGSREPTFANSKDNLCGDALKPCPAGYRCFDGFNCCPDRTPVCGGKCCGDPWTCVGNTCVPPGSKPCGAYFCSQDWECLETDLCCRASDTVCNHKCCVRGNVCRSGMCVLPDEEPCGVTVGISGSTTALRMCHLPEQFCADPATGLCCNSNTQQIPCGNQCCPTGYNCVNLVCTPPAAPTAQTPSVVVLGTGQQQQQQQQQQQEAARAITINQQVQAQAEAQQQAALQQQQQQAQQQAQLQAQLQAQQQAQFQAQLQAQLQAQQQQQQPNIYINLAGMPCGPIVCPPGQFCQRTPSGPICCNNGMMC